MMRINRVVEDVEITKMGGDNCVLKSRRWLGTSLQGTQKVRLARQSRNTAPIGGLVCSVQVRPGARARRNNPFLRIPLMPRVLITDRGTVAEQKRNHAKVMAEQCRGTTVSLIVLTRERAVSITVNVHVDHFRRKARVIQIDFCFVARLRCALLPAAALR